MTSGHAPERQTHPLRCPLIKILYRTISQSSCSRGGALMRRLERGAGCGVPRACLAHTSREAGGHRPGPLRGSAASVRLDVDRGGWGEPARVPPHEGVCTDCPGRTVPACQKPRGGAPAGAATRFVVATALRLASHPPQPRLPARRSPHVRRGDLLIPRTPQAPRESRSLAV